LHDNPKQSFHLPNRSNFHWHHVNCAMAYILQLLGCMFSLTIIYTLLAPHNLFSSTQWLSVAQIIGCPKEPDLDIWAANLGYAIYQSDFVLKLSCFSWNILRYIENFLSTQNVKRMIIVSTIHSPKVVSQAL